MTGIPSIHTEAMKKGGLTALFLHGAIFLIFVWFALYKPAHKLVDAYVFELVAAPGDLTAAPGVAPSLEKSPEPMPAVQLVKAPEVAEAVPMPVVDISEPIEEQEAAEEAVEEVAVVPAPKVAKQSPPKNNTDTKEAVKKDAAKPTENTKKVSYKDFVKKQGKPKPAVKGAKATPKKGAKIDTQGAKLALTKALGGKGGGGGANGVAGGTAIDGALVDSFNSALLRKIDTAWLRPTTVIVEGMYVLVEFEVASTGKISNVRIVQSSGNDEVDRSVREAFIKVGNAGKPPHAEGGVYRLRFRVE